MGKKIQLLGLALKDLPEFKEQKTVLLFLGFDPEQVNKFIIDFDNGNKEIFNFDFFNVNTKTEETIYFEKSEIDYYKYFEIDSLTENDTKEDAADQFMSMLVTNLFNIVDIYLLMHRDLKVLYDKGYIDQKRDAYNNLIDEYNLLNDSRKEVIDAYQILFNKYNALFDDYEKIINKYNNLNHQTRVYSREIQNLKYTNQSIEKASQIQLQNFENKLASRKIICPKCNGTGKIRHYNASMKTWIDDYCCPVCNGNKRVNEYG
jgi:hypothetical protein